MDYKQEFLSAKKANDWNRLQVVWTALCAEAEVELSDEESQPGGINKELAEYRNRQAAGNFEGGKKI